uniref:Uncharacterized protein n=1 Tax=Eptatretus burgeri TaxID=7764 RepID=A0A8C4PZJ4_EPTBU
MKAILSARLFIMYAVLDLHTIPPHPSPISFYHTLPDPFFSQAVFCSFSQFKFSPLLVTTPSLAYVKYRWPRNVTRTYFLMTFSISPCWRAAMSKASSSKSQKMKTKKKDRIRCNASVVSSSLSVAPTLTVRKIARCITESEWMAIVKQEEGEIIVMDIMQELMSIVMDRCYKVYIEMQLFPYMVNWVKEAVLQVVECRFIVHDGEKDIAEDVTWQEDSEPVPCAIDSWASGAVPIQNTDNDSAINLVVGEISVDTVDKEIKQTALEENSGNLGPPGAEKKTGEVVAKMQGTKSSVRLSRAMTKTSRMRKISPNVSIHEGLELRGGATVLVPHKPLRQASLHPI